MLRSTCHGRRDRDVQQKALKKLKMTVLGVCEELMRGMERMDELKISREDEALRGKRKTVVKNTEVLTAAHLHVAGRSGSVDAAIALRSSCRGEPTSSSLPCQPMSHSNQPSHNDKPLA